jgi:hypothetical protein
MVSLLVCLIFLVLYISLARLPGFAKLYDKERESGSIGKNVFFSIQSADKIENVPVDFFPFEA